MWLFAWAFLSLVQFSTTVNLVEVYASVTKPGGEIADELTADDFVVFEDGVPQRIQTFARGEVPLSVVIAIDRSFSMAGPPLRLARQSARTFLDALRPEDRALIVAIGSEVDAIGELSSDRSQQYAALDSLVPWGTTSLHDAIVQVVDRIGAGSGRRAIVVLSDGQDRYSQSSAEDVRGRVRRSDVLVYGITLAKQSSPLFADLAAISGGRAFHITTAQQLPGVFSTIAHDLRTQYLLGYAPPPGPAGWRTISVQVKRRDLRVRARTGYTAQ